MVRMERQRVAPNNAVIQMTCAVAHGLIQFIQQSVIRVKEFH